MLHCVYSVKIVLALLTVCLDHILTDRFVPDFHAGISCTLCHTEGQKDIEQTAGGVYLFFPDAEATLCFDLVFFGDCFHIFCGFFGFMEYMRKFFVLFLIDFSY